jgi:hypothetical protein
MSTNPAQTVGPVGAARIGRWIVTAIPFGWAWIVDFGVQKNLQGAFPSNIYLREDVLRGEDELGSYVANQVSLMAKTFLAPQVAGPGRLAFAGADEAALLMLKHQPTEQGIVFQVQHYVRSGKWVGIATLTTLEAELLAVRPDFDQFMKLLKIAPESG